ncbi:hypothetical protein RYX56_25305, partial [Alkalihalophilus lindianensis]
HGQLQAIKLKLHQEGSQLHISLTKEALGQALIAAKHYRDHLYSLRDLFQKCTFTRKRSEDLQHRLSEIETELDELKG